MIISEILLREKIYDLARKSYLAVKDSEFENFDMIHTENFMLIDKKRQKRRFYHRTDKNEIIMLLSDTEILKIKLKWKILMLN